MPDVKSLPEKYATASVSSNPRLATDRASVGDSLLAVAMAGTSQRLGTALWRVRNANDRSSYTAALAIVCGRVRRWRRNKKWQDYEVRQSRLIAKMALDWWLWAVCPTCKGLGYERVPNADNVLSDTACGSCRGRGKTPIDHVVPARLLDRCRDVTDMLDLASSELHTQAGRRLRDK